MTVSESHSTGDSGPLAKYASQRRSRGEVNGRGGRVDGGGRGLDCVGETQRSVYREGRGEAWKHA